MRLQERAPVHPGKILLNHYIAPLNLTIMHLSEMLGVSRKAVSAIVNEHKSITPDMALRLSQAFDTTADLWLNLQKNYDLWQAANRSQEWKKVKRINCELNHEACAI
ncbi:MAG: HigA family addiction module antidote protein [Desulfobacterales bacterium]|nr:HigA family addiction module antidote protein [Desulfobacterales bacterium]